MKLLHLFLFVDFLIFQIPNGYSSQAGHFLRLLVFLCQASVTLEAWPSGMPVVRNKCFKEPSLINKEEKSKRKERNSSFHRKND